MMQANEERDQLIIKTCRLIEPCGALIDRLPIENPGAPM